MGALRMHEKAISQNIAFTDCIGTLSLPEVISACDSRDAVITHDAGLLHMAGLSTACLLASLANGYGDRDCAGQELWAFRRAGYRMLAVL